MFQTVIHSGFVHNVHLTFVPLSVINWDSHCCNVSILSSNTRAYVYIYSVTQGSNLHYFAFPALQYTQEQINKGDDDMWSRGGGGGEEERGGCDINVDCHFSVGEELIKHTWLFGIDKATSV